MCVQFLVVIRECYQTVVVDLLNALHRNYHALAFPDFSSCVTLVAMVTGVRVEFFPGIHVSVLSEFVPARSQAGQKSQ